MFSVLQTMTDQAAKKNIVAMTRIPLYSLTEQQIEGKK